MADILVAVFFIVGFASLVIWAAPKPWVSSFVWGALMGCFAISAGYGAWLVCRTFWSGLLLLAKAALS
jgi:hypothetical protein